MSNDDAESLLLRRIVLVQDELRDSVATEIIARMLYLHNQNPRAEIQLHIDSPGGSVAAGFAIVDTIRYVTSTVHTVCTMTANGTAAVILAAGRRGSRFVHPTASIAITPLELGDSKGVTTLDADRELDRWRSALADLVVDFTRQPRETVLNDLQYGKWFDANGAIAYGLADRYFLDD